MAATATATRSIPLGRRNGPLALMRALVGVGMQREAAPVAAALVLEWDEWVRERNGSGSANGSANGSGLPSGHSRSNVARAASNQPTGATMSATKTKPDLAQVATAVAKATRLKGAEAVISAKSGSEARIVYDGRTLAFVRALSNGRVRVHVQHFGKRAEDRMTVENVQQAAAAVKQSERRQPKPAKS
jgi:hypothetical protein